MKTVSEMIAVMQAFEKGEQIEVFSAGKWVEHSKPLWDWMNFDYRVKTNKHFVPFDTAEEFLAAQREHGLYVFFGEKKYTAFINSNGVLRLTLFNNLSNAVVSDLDCILEDFRFADGTPCGKEV